VDRKQRVGPGSRATRWRLLLLSGRMVPAARLLMLSSPDPAKIRISVRFKA
jgi:hypothetical protein